MTPQRPHPADEEEQLDGLIADYLEAEAAGRTPDRQEMLDRHPAVRGQLARYFANHDRLERMAAPLR